MKIYGWKELFAPHILMRGQKYAFDGSVEDVKVGEDGDLVAVVRGTDEYNVRIRIDKNHKVVDMDCDCPYSNDGNHCKHEAAVLYAVTYDDDFTYEDFTLTEEQEKSLESCINGMDHHEAIANLMAICTRNREAYEYICSRYPDVAPVDENAGISITPVKLKSVDRIVLEISLLEDDFYDYDGWMDEERGYAYLQAVRDRIESYVPAFVEAGRLMDAFDITTKAMDIVVDVELDDSFGGITELYEAISGFWETIFEQASEDDRKRIDATLRSMELEDDEDYYWDFIHEFRMSHLAGCDGRNLLYKEDVEYLDSHDDPESRASRYEHIAKDALELLIAEKTPGSVIREFIWRYGPVFGLETRALSYLEENQFLEDAYDLMVALYSDEKNNHGISRGELAYRLYGYRKAQEPETALELLRKAVLEDKVADDVKIFRLLKDSESDDLWNHDTQYITRRYLRRDAGIREIIAASLILIESGRCSDVLDFLEKDSDCSFFMDELRGDLIPCDPERTWKIDRFLLMQKMDRSYNRGGYSSRVEKLVDITSLYPDGDELAREVAEEWKSRYPKKTAMLDEIRRAGL